jgi:DNA-binding XRE family transcriptional regulator
MPLIRPTIAAWVNERHELPRQVCELVRLEQTFILALNGVRRHISNVCRARRTQAEFAERVGIDRSFLADVERGKRNISILNVELIANALKISLSQLFSRL